MHLSKFSSGFYLIKKLFSDGNFNGCISRFWLVFKPWRGSLSWEPYHFMALQNNITNRAATATKLQKTILCITCLHKQGSNLSATYHSRVGLANWVIRCISIHCFRGDCTICNIKKTAWKIWKKVFTLGWSRDVGLFTKGNTIKCDGNRFFELIVTYMEHLTINARYKLDGEVLPEYREAFPTSCSSTVGRGWGSLLVSEPGIFLHEPRVNLSGTDNLL